MLKKLYIAENTGESLLNQRNELISKCRHMNNFGISKRFDKKLCQFLTYIFLPSISLSLYLGLAISDKFDIKILLHWVKKVHKIPLG